MEEKERYVWVDRETTFYSDKLYDRTTGEKYHPVYATDLLNYQDREIKRLTKMLYTATEHADKLNEENNKLNKELKKCKQAQKQLAIEKLEEVKKILSFDTYNIKDNRFDCTRTIILWDDLNSIIDNQVKKLKGEI